MSDPHAGATSAPRQSLLPSLNFLLVLLAFSGSGALLWNNAIDGRFAIFLFVVSGWVVGLCLHEFAHAMTAYLGGDASVARTGYLDLDPMRYTDPTLSLILPLLFIVIGGFGLPGGLVYIQTGRLRSKVWQSAVSAAGPLMSLAFLLVLALLYAMLPGDGSSDMAAGLGILAYFEATAIILCVLPIPGLDGFGVIRPFLPRDFAEPAEQMGMAAFYLLFFLIWLTPVGGWLFGAGRDMTLALGIDFRAIVHGYRSVKLF